MFNAQDEEKSTEKYANGKNIDMKGLADSSLL